MAPVTDLPASKFIRFLSSYGGDEENLSLFDEHVMGVAKRYKITQFELESQFADSIAGDLRGCAPTSILLAGDAGDGKSNHLRKVWVKLGGDLNAWLQDGDKTLDITLDDGKTRSIRFIKDLSATQCDFEALWRDTIESEHDSGKSVVIACNQGQILSQLRRIEQTIEGVETFADKLEDIFFKEDSEKSIGHIKIYDLSRQSQADRLEELIRTVAMHSGWDGCTAGSCSCLSKCPIRKNLSLLWDREKNQKTKVTDQLCNILKIEGYDKCHFSIRDLFLLVSNAILGCSGQKKLANCKTVQKILDKNETISKDLEIDLYENILGKNLNIRTRSKKVIFKYLSNLEIGEHDDPVCDRFIMSRKDDAKAGFSDYKHYFSDLNEPAEMSEKRNDWLKRARRRLFFNEPTNNKVWALTAYKHIQDFLNMRNEAITYQQVDQRILNGLSRIMSGSAIHDGKDEIVLTTNGAEASVPVGNLIVATIKANYDDDDSRVKIEIDNTSSDAVPDLVFRAMRPLDEMTEIRFPITPRRYEFLACLAEGKIPTGFSSQCQGDFYDLKTLLVRAFEKDTKRDSKRVRLTLSYSTRHKTVQINIPQES